MHPPTHPTIHLPTYPFIYLFSYLPTRHPLPTHPSIYYLSIYHPSSIHLSTHQSIHTLAYFSIHLSFPLLDYYQPTHRTIYPSIHLPTRPSICSSIHPLITHSPLYPLATRFFLLCLSPLPPTQPPTHLFTQPSIYLPTPPSTLSSRSNESWRCVRQDWKGCEVELLLVLAGDP